jgi:hypothetical protein
MSIKNIAKIVLAGLLMASYLNMECSCHAGQTPRQNEIAHRISEELTVPIRLKRTCKKEICEKCEGEYATTHISCSTPDPRMRETLSKLFRNERGYLWAYEVSLHMARSAKSGNSISAEKIRDFFTNTNQPQCLEFRLPLVEDSHFEPKGLINRMNKMQPYIQAKVGEIVIKNEKGEPIILWKYNEELDEGMGGWYFEELTPQEREEYLLEQSSYALRFDNFCTTCNDFIKENKKALLIAAGATVCLGVWTYVGLNFKEFNKAWVSGKAPVEKDKTLSGWWKAFFRW